MESQKDGDESLVENIEQDIEASNEVVSDVGFDRYGHTDTDTDTDIVIPIYSKPIPILASRIHTDTDTDIWFGIQIKPIPIIGINRYHTDICIPISVYQYKGISV